MRSSRHGNAASRKVGTGIDATAEGSDLVSVVVPAYNSERFIGRTLDSIVGQSHRRLEVLVVDDGSTDKTPDIVAGYARRDGRIRLLRQKNRGPAAARNLGARTGTGEFIAPCDSDDIWHRDKISRQLAAFHKASPDTGLAYCWSEGIDELDRIIFPNWARHTAEGMIVHAMIEDNLPGSGSAALIRRNLFERVGGYPEDLRYGDEWQLHIAMAGAGKCTVVRDFLVGYRLRSDSITSNFSNVAADLYQTTDWVRERWPETPKAVLTRRALVVNRYLAFLAARQRHFGKALHFRCKAWRASPWTILSLEPLDFGLMLLGQLLRINRYYYDVWRRPSDWSNRSSSSDQG